MDTDNLTNYDNPDSFGSRMRARRLAPLIDMIRDVHAEKGAVSILDVGGRETYWRVLPAGFLSDHKVTITILNLPSDLQGSGCTIFTHAVGDACDLNHYHDNEFDIVHSNSVIEHVGDWRRIKAFARESRRLAPRLFIQTPNFWFPIEPHFIKPFHHWLPKPWRACMWISFKMGQRGRALDLDDAMAKVDDEPYLLSPRMFRLLYPDCRILRERFLFFTKSMVALRKSPQNG